MTTFILGLGIGLFAILTIWLSAALIFIVALRIDKRIGFVALIIAAIITVILVTVPRSSEHPASHQDKPYDQLFIWRVLLSSVLAGSSLIALVGYVKYELIECKRPEKVIARSISLLSRSNKKFEIADNTEFVDKVMNSNVPVIVNFHAEWCDPCKILTPKLEELIGPMKDLHLAIIDVEQNPELVHTFEVKAVPAVIAVSNGLVVDKFIGLVDAGMIDNLIKKLVHVKSDSSDGK